MHAAPLRLGDVIGNPELKPQLIRTLEYQMSWKPSSFFGITSAVAYNWLEQKAEFTPDGSNQTARNVASQNSLAWETRADLSHYEDYNIYAAFDLVASERDLGQQGYVAELVGQRNVAYPPWIGRAGVIVAVPSLPRVPLRLGAEGILVGPRRASDASVVERGEPFTLTELLHARSVALHRRNLPGARARVAALRTRNITVAARSGSRLRGLRVPARSGRDLPRDRTLLLTS